MLAGCSFTDNPDFPRLAFGEKVHDHDYAKIVSFGGAGNRYIAHSILENLTDDTSHVFVLWSGISRIDISIPVEMESHILGFDHRKVLGDAVWLMTGGYGGSWCMETSKIPKFLSLYLKNQYLPHNWNYLATQNLASVAGCLAILEQKNINYTFGFIYDIFADHSDQASLGGPVSKNNPMAKHIPWDKCIPSYPYDFCKKNNLLSNDDFHPSEEGYQAWIDSVKQYLPKVG